MKLSKSRFVAGVQCLKRLYFQVHHIELAGGVDEGSQAVMEQGRLVGLEARKAFANGAVVDSDQRHLSEALTVTEKLLHDPAIPVIFEATVEADNIIVRADILKRGVGDSFGLIEVKSSTRTERPTSVRRWHTETCFGSRRLGTAGGGCHASEPRLCLPGRRL